MSSSMNYLKSEHPWNNLPAQETGQFHYKTPRGEHRQNTLQHKSQQDPL